ncbi:MAG: DNA repair protein RadC [Candidatus Taylorbacteria bacterium]|nr:DNA repair protein RadC [Candidatus Taylorbacteria bacterium]
MIIKTKNAKIIKKQSNRLYSLMDTDLFLDTSNREYILKVHDLPLESQPRERLIKKGPEILTLQELMAIILNTGTRSEGVLDMSSRIIREYGEKSIMSEKNPEKLSSELNIPIVKACQIVACGEIGRRLYEKNDSGFAVIRTAKDVYEYLQDMHNLPKEHLRGLYLNSHNRVIHDEVISIGTINTNIVHPREVFRPAIEYSAAAVVLAHNHPSNIATPSAQDIEITHQLISAGKILGINVLDHVIITKSTYVSINAQY